MGFLFCFLVLYCKEEIMKSHVLEFLSVQYMILTSCDLRHVALSTGLPVILSWSSFPQGNFITTLEQYKMPRLIVILEFWMWLHFPKYFFPNKSIQPHTPCYPLSDVACSRTCRPWEVQMTEHSTKLYC